MITLIIGEVLKCEVTFPCRDCELEEKLKSIGITGNLPSKARVSEVIEPRDLTLKLNQVHNLDEINYLAKRMYCFDRNEMATFMESVKQEKLDTPKDLINATFNLQRYALIQDVSDMAKVGRHYMLTKQGCLTESEIKELDFAAIGKEILSVGDVSITNQGLLIKIGNAQLYDVYDGTTFPEYDYIGDGFLKAELYYNGKTEYICLPDDDLSITKAVARLNAPNVESCQCDITEMSADISDIKDVLNGILDSENLYAVNRAAFYINDENIDLKKLKALVEYAGKEDSYTLCALARGIEQFTFIEDIGDDEDIGRYYVENYDNYRVNPDLDDFIKFDEFGDWMKGQTDGVYVSNGYVSMNNNYTTLDDVLEQYSVNEEAISMGGI